MDDKRINNSDKSFSVHVSRVSISQTKMTVMSICGKDPNYFLSSDCTC